MQERSMNNNLSDSHQESIYNEKTVFNNPRVISIIEAKCPRLLSYYTSISQSYFLCNSSTEQQNLIFKKISSLVSGINFQPRLSPSSICGKDVPHGYYECYDCRKVDLSCFCQECFSEEQHAGHMLSFVDNDSGCCDCGDTSMIKQEGICAKHRNRPDEQPYDKEYRETTGEELKFLLSLAIAAVKDKNSLLKQDKSIVLVMVLKKLTGLVLQSAYYQKLISEVLLIKVDTEVICQPLQLGKILLHTRWTEIVQEKISELLMPLIHEIKLTIVLVPIILKMVSEEGMNIVVKAKKLKDYVRQSVVYRDAVKQFLDVQNIRFMIIRSKQTSIKSCLVLLNFYDILSQLHPDLFVQMWLLLIQKVQVKRWLNITHLDTQNKLQIDFYENRFFKRIIVFFQLIHNMESQRVEDCCLKLMKNSFKTMVEFDLQKKYQVLKRDLGLCSQIFALSVLHLCKGDRHKLLQLYKPLIEIISNRLLEQDSPNYQTLIITLIKSLNRLILGTFNNDQYTVKVRSFYLSLNLISIKVVVNVIDTGCPPITFLQTLLKYYTQQGVQLNKNVMRQIFITFKHAMWALESELDFLISLNTIEENKFAQQKEVRQLYSELAFLYKDKSKTQFKNSALNWINNEPVFKAFFVDQYQAIKKGIIEPQIRSNLSFNSIFCLSESTRQKNIRFTIKYKKYSTLRPWLISQNKGMVQIINLSQQLIDKYLDQEQNEDNLKETLAFINQYIPVLITYYLQTKQDFVKKSIQKLVIKDQLKNWLTGENQQIIGLYQMLTRHETKDQIRENHEEEKRTQIKMKKDKKIQELKERQKKIISQNYQEEQSPKKQQHQCIICKLNEEKQPLQYLCRVRSTNLLTNLILKSDQPFLLFTTCGHLIHQSCLTQNIEGVQQFRASYSCFLCKTESNLRLPFSYGLVSEKQTEVLFNSLQTIMSIEKGQEGNNSQENKSESKSQEVQLGLSKGQYLQQLHNSVFFSIYLYYLTDSRLYIHYILPITSNLLDILIHQCHLQGIKTLLTLEHLTSKDLKALRIKMHIQNIISGKNHLFQTEVSKNVKEHEEGSTYLSEDSVLEEIDKIFLKIACKKHSLLTPIKQIHSLNLFKPPQDLQILKRMVTKCSYCNKLVDKLRLCFLCKEKTCLKCEKDWKKHISSKHKGSSVSVMIRNGCYFYESSDSHQSMRCLYRDYMGDPYDAQKVEVKKGVYQLDEGEYSNLVEDLVMDNIRSKILRKRLEIRQNCTIM